MSNEGIENTFSEFNVYDSDCWYPCEPPNGKFVEIQYFNGLPVVLFYKEEISKDWITALTLIHTRENDYGINYEYKIQTWITKNNSLNYLSPDTLKNCKIYGKVILCSRFSRNGWRYHFEPTEETEWL